MPHGAPIDWSRYAPGFLEAAVDSIVVIDRDGTILFWNPGAEKLYGYPAQESVGSSILMIMPERGHPRMRALIESAWEGESSGPSEVVRVRKDGTPVHVSLTAFPIRDRQGDVIAVCSIGRDITVRKQTEESLRVREAQLRSAQALATLGGWAWDPESDQMTWSDQMFLIAGQEPRPAPLDIAEVTASIHPDDRELFREAIRTILDDHQPFELEYRVVRPDGLTRTVAARGEVHLNEDGQVDRVAGTALDITDRRLVESSLIRAREEALAASTAKGHFLANMSHEIRTPLNGVIGMVGLLLDTELDDRQREFLDIARESAESLLELIEDILDFSKIEAGRMDLESVPFDAGHLISATAATFALRAHAKGLELLVDLDPALGTQNLVGDPNRLRQILVNLVSNAVKFTEEGEIVLRAKSEPLNGDTMLHVSVSDTGIGISDERVEAIFQEFSQADASTSRKYGGTGLGLTISARLVELMGGRIWVESEPGEGSTFHFTARFGRAASVEPRTRELGSDASRQRLLVVDDNATNRKILQEMLGNWGFRVTTKADAPSALEACKTARDSGHPFALAIIDRQMPSVDGFTLAAEMGKTSPPILLMLSSSDAAGDRERAKDLRIERYLLKPIREAQLHEALVDLLGTDNEEPGTDVMEDAPPARAEPPARTLRVLLAEDNAVNQRLERILLEKHGHEVDIAQDGAEAVARFTSNRYDVVLMDVQMPGMDGLEAARTIRKREQTTGRARTPIIAITARAMAGDREQCLAAGMDGYVSKPLRPADLDAELARVIDAAGSPPPDDPSTAAAVAQGELGDIRVFDRETLLTLVAGDRTLVSELTEIFLDSLPHLLDELSAAMRSINLTRMQAAAHALAGSAGNLRAERLAKVARDLEELSRRGENDAVEEAYERVVVEAKELERRLRGGTGEA